MGSFSRLVTFNAAVAIHPAVPDSSTLRDYSGSTRQFPLALRQVRRYLLVSKSKGY
jgi:hypothetical protein